MRISRDDGTLRFRIRLDGDRSKIYAKDAAEVAMAVRHYWRSPEPPYKPCPKRCPLCRRIAERDRKRK